MLFWDYVSAAARAAGALPPEPLALPFADQPAASPFPSRDYATIWRAIESGYEVRPGDCPPIRLIARYGYGLRCPGRVGLARLAAARREREFGPDVARFGIVQVEGDAWPQSDSGLVASWIAGSEFVKVHTGIVVYFPTDYYLYQGPVPNATLVPDSTTAEVMAGLEYAVPRRSTIIDGRRYGIAEMNVIVRLPPVGGDVRIQRTALIGWVMPVPSRAALQLRPRPRTGGDPSPEVTPR